MLTGGAGLTSVPGGAGVVVTRLLGSSAFMARSLRADANVGLDPPLLPGLGLG